MTDTRIDHEIDADTRTEALQWLARRVRWERFLTSLHDDAPADLDDIEEISRPSRAA